MGNENNEECLLSYARYGTASQLDKTVRLYRHVSTRWDEHGCLEIRARLTLEQGALVIKAIEAAVESVAQSEPAQKSESHALEVTKDTSAGVFPINNNQQYPQQRADALVLMAEAFLKDTKVASSTGDRYQVVVLVDSDVLSQKVFEKPSGEPDCYIDKQNDHT